MTNDEARMRDGIADQRWCCVLFWIANAARVLAIADFPKDCFGETPETSTRDACATQSPESGLQSALQLCFPARISAGATRDLSRQLRSRDERPSRCHREGPHAFRRSHRGGGD